MMGQPDLKINYSEKPDDLEELIISNYFLKFIEL